MLIAILYFVMIVIITTDITVLSSRPAGHVEELVKSIPSVAGGRHGLRT